MTAKRTITGKTGGNGLFFQWECNSIAGAAVGTGNISFDDSTPSNVAQIIIHKNSDDGVATNTLIGDCKYINIREQETGRSYLYEITTATASSTYYTLAVVVNGGLISEFFEDEAYSVSFLSDVGSGGSADYGGFFYGWKAAATSATPATGYFSVNNANPTSATTLIIHKNSQTQGTNLMFADMKYVLLRDKSTDNAVTYEITNTVASSTYYTLTVNTISGGGTLTALTTNQEYNVSFLTDTSSGGDVSYGGFFGTWWMSSTAGAAVATGESSVDDSNAVDVTTGVIHKNDNYGVGFNNALEDFKYVMFTNKSDDDKIVYEVSSITDSTSYVTVTMASVGGSLTTFIDDTEYDISIFGQAGGTGSMSSFDIANSDGTTVHTISDGYEIRFNGQDGLVFSIQSVDATTKSIRLDITTNAVNGEVITDNTLKVDKLNGVGVLTENTPIMGKTDDTFTAHHWGESNMPYIGDLSIAGNGSQLIWTITPPTGSTHPTAPIVFVYDDTNDQNIDLYNGGTAYVQRDTVNTNFDIVFKTAPATGKTYTITYIC